MFCTWKYDPETDEVQNIRKAFDPITARSSQHQACNRCHEKKLKCSGDRNGCDRCISSKLPCDYSRSGSRSRRRKHSTQPSTTDTASITSTSSRGARDGTRSPSSPGHTQLSRSSTSTAARNRRTSKNVRKTSASPSADVHQRHSPISALNQLDLTSLGPEDQFDMSLLGSTMGGEYAATTAPDYGAVTAAYYPPQPAYGNPYDAWSNTNYSNPPTCGAMEHSYMATTTGPTFHTAPAHAYQDYGSYGDYPQPWASR